MAVVWMVVYLLLIDALGVFCAEFLGVLLLVAGLELVEVSYLLVPIPELLLDVDAAEVE